MIDPLVELDITIRIYTAELKDLSLVIKVLDDEIIRNTTNDESTDDLQTQFWDVAKRYKKTCEKLEKLLEIYFQHEDRSEYPANITFRRLYKKLKEGSAHLGPLNIA